MIETTDEAVTYLEMVARRESGDLAEAALIVTRTLRQATQTLADHAQASGVREGDGAGVSDEALRAERDDLKRKGELLCQAYGEHLIEHGSGGRCGAERDRLREGILSLEHAFHNKGEMWWGVWKTLRALASGEESR